MHIPKINAENIDPKLWRAANSKEDINTAKTAGTINCNLFKKTPLKINSSEIGEINIVAIKLPVKNELNRLKDGTIPKI